MNIAQTKAWNAWVRSRPPKVRKMARKYPIGTRFLIHGEVAWVISYQNDGVLCVTTTDPRGDYEKAVRERVPVCLCCVGKLDSLVIWTKEKGQTPHE